MKKIFLKQSLKIVLLIFINTINPLHAGTITGAIFNPVGKPLLNVHIILLPKHTATISNEQGIFRFTAVPAGNYSLTFDHISYQVKTVPDIQIIRGKTIYLDSLILLPAVIEMEELFVTANRYERRVQDISQSINLVSEFDINARQAKTSAEALREENGIFVQKTNHGGGSAIIRGFSSNQILILVDGVRLNNSIYRLGNHQYLTTVDNHSLRQIEVVRGPTSAAYGSDALGGTINLLTKQPEFSAANRSLDYHLFSRFASADGERTFRAETVIAHQKVAWLAGFSLKKFDDLQRGGNSSHPQLEKSTPGLKQNPSGFRGSDFDTKLIYKIRPFQTLLLAWQHSRRGETPRYDKYENNGYYRWVYKPQNRNLVYINYRCQIHSKYLSEIRATGSLNLQEEGRETQPNRAAALVKEKDKVRTLGFTLQFNANLKHHQPAYGIELYSDHVQSERFSSDPELKNIQIAERARFPDGARYNSAGIYFQDEIRLSRKWSITSGVRFSYFHTYFEMPDDSTGSGRYNQDFHALTGSIRSTYRVTAQSRFYLDIGQAFRAPNLSDLAKFGESKGDIYEIPNSDLAPENLISFDFGYKLTAGKFRTNIAVYYAKISDLIASAPATYAGLSTIQRGTKSYRVKMKKNLGTGFIRGFEFSAAYSISGNLVWQVNLTDTYGQNSSAQEPVGGIPPFFGLAGIEWKKDRFQLKAYSRFAAWQTRLSCDDLDDPRIPAGGTPGWWTINLRAGIRLNSAINIRMAVKNILDLNYREHGSGINGAGRNFIISLRYRG